MRDGRLAHVKALDNVADTNRFSLGGDQAKDVEPGGIAQCPKERHELCPRLFAQRRSFSRDGTTVDGSELDRLHGARIAEHIDGCLYEKRRIPAPIKPGTNTPPTVQFRSDHCSSRPFPSNIGYRLVTEL